MNFAELVGLLTQVHEEIESKKKETQVRESTNSYELTRKFQ